MDHRDDEAVVDSHGHAHVHLRVAHEGAVLPRHVPRRMARQRGGAELHEQVGVGDARAGLRARALAPRREARHLNLAHQVEVRRARPARRHPLGHDAPDRADAAVRGGLALLARRHGARGGRLDGGLDVGDDDGPARPGAGERRQIQPALGREPARLRRGGGEAPAVPLRARAARLHVGEHVGLVDPPGARGHLREIDAVLLGDPPRQRRRLDPAPSPLGGEGRGEGRLSWLSRSTCVLVRPPLTLPSPQRGEGRAATRCGGRRLAGREDQGDRLAHRHHVALLGLHVAEHAGCWGFQLDRDLVGLDLHDRLALRHGGARGLEPAQDLAGLLRQLERGHDDGGRHHAFLQSARAASKTDFSDGTVRSSSTGENGTGTSMAPMRLTGASRW